MGNETELIKERIALADVVSEYVKLKPAGRSLKGLCPFHQEKSPSFVVSPERNSWYCFGCFPPGEKVKTPFGYHNIETLDDKHHVISGTGEIRKIVRPLTRNYEGELVTVRVRKLQYPVKMTADHNVLAIRGAPSTRKYKVFARRYRKYMQYREEGNVDKYTQRINKYFPIRRIPAGELQTGDILLYPIDDSIEDYEVIDLSKYLGETPQKGPKVPEVPLVQPLAEDFLKLIGYYIAEGSNHRAYIRFSLGNHEEEFAQEVVTLIDKLFGLKAVIHRRKKGEKTGIEITACHAYLATIFANLLGKGAAHKHIPFEWQRLPSDKQKVLLYAMHRGDGTSYIASKSAKTHHSITSISRVLAEQITDMLLRAGFFPSVTVKTSSIDKLGVNHREAYTVIWSNEAQSRYNLVYYDQGKKYWMLPAASLARESYKGPVYNLTVDIDHTYVTSSFAVANCSEGGDLFSFVQRIEGLDFVGSLKMLAERAGVELKSRSESAVSTNRRQRLFDLLALTARFYHQILCEHSGGKQSLEYLKERGVTKETIDSFVLGYAPASWDILQKFLKQKGYQEDEMVESGVIGRSQRGKLYDRFRGRIMFPISDTQGRVLAFGGRIVPWQAKGDEGKYINSPETSLYEKRRVVYNLDKAKTHLRNNPCIVVEGYMDVIMLVQHGIKNVVASSGTAFTEDQIKQIARFTTQLHFAFDADGAGLKATLAATEAALSAGMRVATITIPTGKDPADLALADPDNVEKHFSKSRSLVSVLLEQMKEAADADSKQEQLQAILPLVSRVNNPIQQGEMIQEMANLLHLPESQIISLLQQHKPAPSFLSGRSPEESEGQPVNLEYHLLGLIISSPEVRQKVFPQLEEEFFLDPSSLKMYNILYGLAQDDPDFYNTESDNLLNSLPPENSSFAEGIYALSQDFLSTSKATYHEEGEYLLQVVRQRSLKYQLTAVQDKLAAAVDDTERARALKEFQVLAEKMSTINSQL